MKRLINKLVNSGFVDKFKLVVTPLSKITKTEGVGARDDVSSNEWVSLSDDPQIYFGKIPALSGWYMLELSVRCSQKQGVAKLYVDYGSGYSEKNSFVIQIANGGLRKRLVYFPVRPIGIRLDPVEAPGEFSIDIFRLVWLTKGFALRRLTKRLRSFHPGWYGKPEKHVLAKLSERSHQEGRELSAVAIEQYDETFLTTALERNNYPAWLERQAEPQSSEYVQRCADVENKVETVYDAKKPLISVLVPVYNTPPLLLRECLDSVLAQYFSKWELCVADDASTEPYVKDILDEYATRDARVKVAYRQENGHISAATNTALEMAEGKFVALLDHDDLLTPDALLCVAESIVETPSVVLVYSDEDKMDQSGLRVSAHFKPDWNPDLLLSQNYICHLSVVRTSRVREVGGFRTGVEGSQDHDLVLRCTANLSEDEIVHIPRVLYHWRAVEGSTALDPGEKDYTTKAGLKAVRDFLSGDNNKVVVEAGVLANTYRVVWPLPEPQPLVSVIIPTRDAVEILRSCVNAILEMTDYNNFELLIVDNESVRPETLEFFSDVQADPRVRILEWHAPFNYSAINNFAAREARGELLAFVNNDVEPITSDWLSELVRQACRPEIGCVGAKLYYPDGTIQHAGIILGLGGVAGHPHQHFNNKSYGYAGRLVVAHNLSAVTAACMVLRRDIFDSVGGFDEDNLPVAYNDVDLCLRVREAGYRNLWTPYAELYHHESASRGDDTSPDKRGRLMREKAYMMRRWGDMLNFDPAYNPNLTRSHDDFSLR